MSNSNAFSTLRNYQTQQQSIFISILNQFYDIVIEIPKKKSVVSLPFLKVLKLTNKNETIKLHDEVSKIIRQLYDYDVQNGVQNKTAKRRLEINKINETLRLMMEIIQNHGFVVYTNDVGKKRIRENVSKIVFDGVELNLNDIVEKGSLISDVIVKERMGGKNESATVCLIKQDIEIMSLLFV